MMAKTAEVRIWDQRVGVVYWDESRPVPTGTFEFDPEFCAIGLQIAPLTMPAEPGEVYEFATLPEKAFKRLPPCLSDSLPDDFGNAVIDAWLASTGRDPRTFTPVERLLYIHNRGMGALEYHPSQVKSSNQIEKIELNAMVELAGKILSQRQEQLDGITIAPVAGKDDEALQQLFKIGSSAGGARAKAIISINDETGDICSGQITAPEGYGYWLLKFDVGDKASELGDPKGFGRIEYAYHLMAVAAGLEMTECRLLEEGPRAHFMTRRFDRKADGDKVHVQTLCAMDTADYTSAGSYSYESALMVCRDLDLTRQAQIQLFRRMVFNIMGRNQDDHTRNISFTVWRDGVWELSPAYDVCWSYNPIGDWTSRHQMSANGKLDDFDIKDLQQVAKLIPRFNPKGVIEDVAAALRRWSEFAGVAKVDPKKAAEISKTFRLYLAEQ